MNRACHVVAAGAAGTLVAASVVAAVRVAESQPVPAVAHVACHELPGTDAEACAHGTDRPPPGVDLRRRPSVEELRGRRLLKRAGTVAGDAAAEDVSTTTGYSVACVGDGVSGKRVLAVYARALDAPDRSAEIVPLIRQYAADVDFRINRSAGITGAGRRVRYVTQPVGTGCQVDVRTVTLSAGGDDTFAALKSELRAQGFGHVDRKYLVWVDAAVGICGVADLVRDTNPGATNRNNAGPMFARTDAPCWGYAEAHELLHTLGAVQADAPNATAAGHCTDENDALCYSDAPGVAMRDVCVDAPQQHVDCGLDDYFNPSPPSGSYLDRSWNVADSQFLEPAGAPPPSPTIAVRGPATMLAGDTVTLSATVSVPAGRTHRLSWQSTRPECRFGAATAATTTFSCPVTLAGSGQVTATVTDSAGLAAAAVHGFAFQSPATPRPTALSAAVGTTRLTYGGSVKLSGRLTDPATGRGVFGMPVAVYALEAGATTWRQVASARTDPTGALAVTLRPARTTTYQLGSGATGTWARANSPDRRVSVAPLVTATLASARFAYGGTASVAGKVSPPHGGQAVVLQRLVSGSWRTVATATLSSTGTATLRWRPGARGTFSLRVYKAADADHIAAASRTFSLAVV